MANPVILKELRGRMRGNRAFILITGYVALMSAFAMMLYFAYTTNSTSGVYSTADQYAGKVLFFGVVGVELFLVCFIAPAFTSNAISGEREKQTYELLRTTLLSARSLVLGKLTSALSFILLLIFAGLPLQSLAFLLGGVATEEVLISFVMLITTAFAFGSWGLFFSALMKRTLGASVMTYAFALFAVLGLPLIMLIFVPFYSLAYYGGGSSGAANPTLQAVVIYSLGLLVCLNPLATGLFTVMYLTNDHSTLFVSQTLSNGTTLPLISPWLPYVLICLFSSFLLIAITIQLVKRRETA